jgi:hypothetical protein
MDTLENLHRLKFDSSVFSVPDLYIAMAASEQSVFDMGMSEGQDKTLLYFGFNEFLTMNSVPNKEISLIVGGV